MSLVIAVVTAALGGGTLTGLAALIQARAAARKLRSEQEVLGTKVPVEVDNVIVSGAERAVLTMERALEAAERRIGELERRERDAEETIDALRRELRELRTEVDECHRALRRAQDKVETLSRRLNIFDDPGSGSSVSTV